MRSTFIQQRKVGGRQKRFCAAPLKNEGISEIWEVISDYFETVKTNGYFQHKRKEQNKFWLMQTIESRLKSEFYANPIVKKELEKQLKALDENLTTPFEAAEKLLTLYK